MSNIRVVEPRAADPLPPRRGERRFTGRLAPRRIALVLVLAATSWATGAAAAPPGAPGAVTGTVDGNRVDLSWVAAGDDEGVTGYNVYRDGRYLTTVSGTSHATTLGPGASTRFYVTAFDSPSDGSARGFSGRSPEAVFSPGDATPPPADGGMSTPDTGDDDTASASRTPTAATRPVARRVSSTSVALSWNAASAADGVRGYNVYRDGSYLTTVRGTSFTDERDIVPGRTHDYYVVAFAARNPTAYGPRSAVVTAPAFVDGMPAPTPDPDPAPAPDPAPDPDPTPDPDPVPTPDTAGRPPAPTGLAATSVAADRVAIAWTRPASDVRGYNVYRDDTYVTTVGGTDARWIDTAPPAGADRTVYQVVAFDTDGNFSPYSAELVVRLDVAPPPDPTPEPDPDPVAPSPSPDGGMPPPTGDLPAPQGLATSLVSNDWAEFQWQPVDGAVAYNVYRDGAFLYAVDSAKTGGQDQRYWKTTSYVDCDYTRFLVCIGQRPEPGAAHVYTVTAIDAAGGEGAVSEPLPVQLLENERLDVRATLEDFRLVVEDEFDAGTLDLERWNTRLPWGPDVTINGEMQYFVDTKREPDFGHDPFELTGDTLRIGGIETPPELADEANGLPFLSGAITMRDSFNFTYGYVEARMKVAKGRGKLSSFFLFHQYAALNAAEIDITEYLGEKPDSVSQNYHWRDERDDETQHPSPTMFEDRPGSPFHADFHTYGVLWEPELVVWTIDDEEILRLEGPEVSRQASYVILYLVMGSAWTEAPDPADADFDVPLEIDWLRIWQRPEFIR